MTDDLLSAMASVVKDSTGVVMAEFEVSSTELHKIANGECCDLNSDLFTVRFLLKDSFKSPRSDFVINKFVMQVVATGKKNPFRKENIAVKTKVIKSEKEKKVQQELDFEAKDGGELF